jgi:hypothetical protein
LCEAFLHPEMQEIGMRGEERVGRCVGREKGNANVPNRYFRLDYE